MSYSYTSPTYSTGQHIVAQDGTHGYVQNVTHLFGETQYVLDPDTILGEHEVVGLHQERKISNGVSFSGNVL